MIKNKVIHVNGKENPKREIPNSLIICITCFHLIFGFDFGFSKIFKKNVRFLANCFCRLTSILIITAFIIQIVHKVENSRLTGSTWLIYGSIQYSFHAIFLSFSNYNLYHLIVDMYLVDTKGDIIKDKLYAPLFITMFAITYGIKSVLCYMLCASSTEECKTLYVPGYSYCILIVGMDVITLVQILIYYYIYNAAKYVKVSLEDKNKDIKWVREQFTTVADICDKITPTYGRLVIVEIASNLPRVLNTSWNMLYYIKNNATYDIILSQLLVALNLIWQLFVPAAIVETVSAQTEALKKILRSRLVEENDNEKNQEIVRFLRYIDARPLHRKVWRLIPVDANLITSLISLCTTYFIVIIQFSHLYD